MTEQQVLLQNASWAKNIDELDRDIGRLASVCRVKILDPGVIERVLKEGDLACETHNPAAQSRAIRSCCNSRYARKAVDRLGQAQTAGSADYMIERLKKSFPGWLEKWPPAP